MNVVPDEKKLSELLLYIAKKLLDDPKGGAIKINKILFAAEYAAVRTYGSPITGVPYQKLRLGPAPRRLVPVREALIAEGSAESRRDWYMGKRLDRLVPLREPDLGAFSDDELAIVDEAISSLWDKTGMEASDESHREMGWRMTEVGETIPYEAAFLAPAFEVTDSIAQHARDLAERLGQ
ncbi:MAG: Panacea domain-containing protein [Actinomycetota bacterium]|nr:Panacea domain-containing protein [Actinomycetota bacterium]